MESVDELIAICQLCQIFSPPMFDTITKPKSNATVSGFAK